MTLMSIALLLIILVIFPYSNANNITLETDTNQNLVTCVTRIINKYYKHKKVTYVDVNYDGNEIIKIIHELSVKVISSDTNEERHLSNLEYVITAGTSNDFKSKFPILTKEPQWNPNAIFLVIIKHLHLAELTGIFDILLKLHVNNVVVVKGDHDVDLFTYNPFDNYNCGKKYDKIIEFGKCLNPRVNNFYPSKLVTGLHNCTFKVTIAHWPPYAIDPKLSKDSMIGAEQYILNIIGELESFDVEYTHSVGGEEFSTIEKNMSAMGNLFMLQNKKTDIMFGGMMLLHFRAAAFDYLSGHLPFMDDVRFLVKKSEPVPEWKNIFLEFDTYVWLALVLTFWSYFILFVAILRVKDKTSLFLVMIDFFFLHGSKMISKSRGIFIIWVFFAYLISAYYQSSLVSMIANPIKSYQISNEEDLTEYNIQPCVSIGIQQYIGVMQVESLQLTYKDGCNGLLDSIRTVSKSHDKFTMSLSSIYLYNQHLFYDEHNENQVYLFKNPVNSIIYAFYLYKGFPLHNKLDGYTTRLRENGLIDKHLRDMNKERMKKISKTTKVAPTKKMHVIFPWYILLVGAVLATGLFIMELFYKKKRRKIIRVTI